MPDQQIKITSDYQYHAFLNQIRSEIQSSRTRAALAVNSELIYHYWRLGKEIGQKFEEQGWGTKIIDKLAHDLDQKGYSPRNLRYMRAFAQAWPVEEILQQVVAKLPWGHNVRLLEYCKSGTEREWYARKALEHGWSRDILALQIENGLYLRQGKAETNFSHTLPPSQSDLARQLLKDPYNFEFLDLTEEAQERDVHQGLLEHIREFLIEMGSGFAFLGSNYHLEVAGKDYYLDLLFYHVKLHCYIVIDLKATEFRPEYVGKMNFYLAAVDSEVKDAEDKPSIGIILCKDRNKVEAEYALRGVSTPIGVAAFDLTKALPEQLKGSLPTIEELEAELESTRAEESQA
ncbi:MAG: DUF1016 family protein [Chloroflexi bacterium]|jgi:predicted nuclease of restriction endonuclease-like (RecB) superfamily|nr:DUF1016 family protein [Chloroflexota bacterium]OJV91688.1 MAG: hypothetical protein BGO39_32920 [Chloroflexi bacterium 54-19]